MAAGDPDLNSNDPQANLRKAVRLTRNFRRSSRPSIDCETISPRSRLMKSLSIAGNFLYMLNAKRPHETLTRVMDAALVLHAEHGMNASTFAARVTAATLADMHAAVTAAVRR